MTSFANIRQGDQGNKKATFQLWRTRLWSPSPLKGNNANSSRNYLFRRNVVIAIADARLTRLVSPVAHGAVDHLLDGSLYK